MKTHVGNLVIDKDTEIDFQEVTGDLAINPGVKLTAKKLETVGGDLSINSEASLDAPKLETVGGYLCINCIYSEASLPKLETVGGYLYIYSETSLPKLVNKGDKTAVITCRAALASSFKKKGLINFDGILSWIISKKKLRDLFVFKVKIVGKLNVSFVVQRAEQYSHGETIETAIESLRYKLSNRDTSEFKKWKKTTKITIDDAIQAYRAITGACEQGVRQFCESKKLPEKLTVSKAIELTDGHFGSDKFAGFFK